MDQTATCTIAQIQGHGLHSPLAGQTVVTRGVVTGVSRKGFFLQDPDTRDTQASSGLFIFSREKLAPGEEYEVRGEVVDYLARDGDKPTTQLKFREAHRLGTYDRSIAPVVLDTELLALPHEALAARLNALEGMLVTIPRGATFVAPSNPFGDYVVAPPELPGLRSPEGGLLVDAAHPERWLPCFRVLEYEAAPRLDIGAALLSDVTGPLNYRSGAYQIVATTGLRTAAARAYRPGATNLRGDGQSMTVMTLNSFNLDPHIESSVRVSDPGLDIDDDVGDGQFAGLARAIVRAGGTPDVVACQEIQDNDGAEQTDVVAADKTFGLLVAAVKALSGIEYRFIDAPPQRGEDGGQPGGNIRNGYLYRPDRVEWVDGQVERMGTQAPAYEGSRKPTVARFRLRGDGGGRELTVINVHLASKRHQHSMFAADLPGFDPREAQRVAQCELIAQRLVALAAAGADYYVTGDFNDFEFSPSLRALCADHSVNLVERLAEQERYDYNHRGQLQVLMHGVVSRRQQEQGRCAYEILHGNELRGVRPGRMGSKASDHAYVIARLTLGDRSTP